MKINIKRRAKQENMCWPEWGSNPRTPDLYWNLIISMAPCLLLVILTANLDWPADILSPNKLDNYLIQVLTLAQPLTMPWWGVMLYKLRNDDFSCSDLGIWPWPYISCGIIVVLLGFLISPLGIFPGIQTVEKCMKEPHRYMLVPDPTVWRHNALFQLSMGGLIIGK